MLDYFFVILPLGAIWFLLFIFCCRSWQLPATFAPLCIYGLYSGNSPWRWLLLIPLLSVLVIDLHIIVKESKFSKRINILTYLLTIPILIIYFYYDLGFPEQRNLAVTIWTYFCQIIILTIVLKFWFFDILLLFINRLWIKNKHYLETQIIEKSTKTVGRTTSYFIIFDNLGKKEVSGFYYLYLKLKRVKLEDRVEIVIRKGCLGVEYITGFPKLLS